MAVQVSPVYIADFKGRHKDKAEGKWRLSRERIADIQDVARGVEETNVGVCCRYLIDYLTEVGSSDIDEDGYIHQLAPIENFCERYDIWGNNKVIDSWRKDIQRCRRAINRMRDQGHHDQVSVLFVVYGYPDPSIRDLPKFALDVLGELASLAKYTDRVEEHRKELARLEAVRISSNIKEPALPPTSTWIEHSLFESAGESAKAAMAIRHGHRAEHSGVFLDLMRHRDRYEWALRVTSSGDALRSLFAPIPNREENETQEHFAVRKDNAETKRDVILMEIKTQATEFLKTASLIYREAWRASA